MLVHNHCLWEAFPQVPFLALIIESYFVATASISMPLYRVLVLDAVVASHIISTYIITTGLLWFNYFSLDHTRICRRHLCFCIHAALQLSDSCPSPPSLRSSISLPDCCCCRPLYPSYAPHTLLLLQAVFVIFVVAFAFTAFLFFAHAAPTNVSLSLSTHLQTFIFICDEFNFVGKKWKFDSNLVFTPPAGEVGACASTHLAALSPRNISRLLNMVIIFMRFFRNFQPKVPISLNPPSNVIPWHTSRFLSFMGPFVTLTLPKAFAICFGFVVHERYRL